MMRMRCGGVRWVCACLVLLSACDKTDASNAEKRPDGGLAGIEDFCGELTYASVSWDASSEAGVAPSAVFGPSAGTCTAPLTWDTSSMGDGVCSPGAGESEITVTVEFDETSAMLGTYEDPDRTDMYDCSETYLKATASVHLATADGVFVDTGEVEVSYGSSSGLHEMRLSVEGDDLGGTFSIDAEDANATKVIYVLGGAGEVCAGELLLSIDRSLGDGVGSTSMGNIGQWSNTGCPLGTEPMDLETPLSDGTAPIEAFDEIWGHRQFDAIWDTEETTVFSIAAELTDTIGCRQASSIDSIPALITYGTADGMLESRTVLGSAGITFTENDLVRFAFVDISDNRFCDTESDNLGYGFGDCTTLSGVTIQLRMEGDGEEWFLSDDGLIAYEYDAGHPSGGASDRIHELTFGFE